MRSAPWERCSGSTSVLPLVRRLVLDRRHGCPHPRRALSTSRTTPTTPWRGADAGSSSDRGPRIRLVWSGHVAAGRPVDGCVRPGGHLAPPHRPADVEVVSLTHRTAVAGSTVVTADLRDRWRGGRAFARVGRRSSPCRHGAGRRVDRRRHGPCRRAGVQVPGPTSSTSPPMSCSPATADRRRAGSTRSHLGLRRVEGRGRGPRPAGLAGARHRPAAAGRLARPGGCLHRADPIRIPAWGADERGSTTSSGSRPWRRHRRRPLAHRLAAVRGAVRPVAPGRPRDPDPL